MNRMSQDIQTELVIPIYDPAQEGEGPDEQHILGVANFEWDESFADDPPRLDDICKQFANKIQKEHVFPLGLFACQVLDCVTRTEREALAN